jgi:RND family efflux transporter MFP subunit
MQPLPIAVLAAATLLLGGCERLGLGGGQTGEAESVAAEEAPARRGHLVTSLAVRRAPVSARHERPGTLKLRRLVRLHTEEEGRIESLELFEGDQVSAGQLVATLDDERLRAELDKARATLDQERLDLKRFSDLAERRAASQDDLAQARTAVALAESDLRLLELRLANTRITAPFAGVVTERLAEPGDVVAKNTHLLTVADPASLVAEVYVSELVLPDIANGDPARIRIDALDGGRFPGEILRIHPTLSESSRQARVEVRFDEIPAGARAGQFVRAELDTAATARLMVPFSALRQDRDGQFVWVIEAGAAARRGVRTGIRIADRIEVLEGLDTGERIITRGFLGLAEGKKVERIDDEGPSVARPGTGAGQIDSIP